MTQKNNLTIQVLSIIGGILTTIFFIGFLILTTLIRNETSAFIVGSLFIAVSSTLSRRFIAPFLDAMNITFYLAGCALVAFSFNQHINILFIVLAATAILTFIFSKGFILPFLSVILLIISIFREVFHLSSSFELLQIAAIPVIAVFLICNLYEPVILSRLKKSLLPKYKAFHSGLFVSCVGLLAGLSIHYWFPRPDWMLSVFIWIGILWVIRRVMYTLEVTRPARQAGIYLLCLLICLPTVFAPYLSGSLLLILICFQYVYKAECAAALLLFIYAISKYYYDLNLSLLVKSVTLVVAGILWIIAWYYFTQKRTKHEKI